jgi:hypothetical protein
MKYVTITSMYHKGQKVAVDDDVYEQIKNCTISHYPNSRYIVVNDLEINKVKSLKKYVVDYNSGKQQLIFINGNKWDYRRQNIKIISRSYEKCKRNTTKYLGNPYKGVTNADPKTGQYKSYLWVGRQIRIYLGAFNSAEEAAKIYDAAVAYYHGKDNAYINFPDELEKLPPDLKEKIYARVTRDNSGLMPYSERYDDNHPPVYPH